MDHTRGFSAENQRSSLFQNALTFMKDRKHTSLDVFGGKSSLSNALHRAVEGSLRRLFRSKAVLTKVNFPHGISKDLIRQVSGELLSRKAQGKSARIVVSDSEVLRVLLLIHRKKMEESGVDSEAIRRILLNQSKERLHLGLGHRLSVEHLSKRQSVLDQLEELAGKRTPDPLLVVQLLEGLEVLSASRSEKSEFDRLAKKLLAKVFRTSIQPQLRRISDNIERVEKTLCATIERI